MLAMSLPIINAISLYKPDDDADVLATGAVDDDQDDSTTIISWPCTVSPHHLGFLLFPVFRIPVSENLPESFAALTDSSSVIHYVHHRRLAVRSA